MGRHDKDVKFVWKPIPSVERSTSFPHTNDADSMLTTGVGMADVMDANWMLVFLPTLTNILP
jgi:hypothetical protein